MSDQGHLGLPGIAQRTEVGDPLGPSPEDVVYTCVDGHQVTNAELRAEHPLWGLAPIAGRAWPERVRETACFTWCAGMPAPTQLWDILEGWER